MDLKKLKEKILKGHLIKKEEAVELVNYHDKQELYDTANEIRQILHGNTIELCSITNAKSGNCSQDCKWCSQSWKHNTGINTYDKIDKNEALKQAKYNSSKGVNRMSLVISGRSVTIKDLDWLLELFNDIEQNTDLKMCASMGLLTKDQLQLLKINGVKTYHCNLETSPRYFSTLCTTHTIDEKIQTIKWAQEVGLDICSGGIIGMGETMQDRIDMAFILQELNVMSIPVNILNYVEGTRIGKVMPLTEEETLTTFALFRFINPQARIRFAAGRINIKHYQEKALLAGVNSAIVGDLLTTIGTSVDEDKELFSNAGFDFIDNAK